MMTSSHARTTSLVLYILYTAIVAMYIRLDAEPISTKDEFIGMWIVLTVLVVGKWVLLPGIVFAIYEWPNTPAIVEPNNTTQLKSGGVDDDGRCGDGRRGAGAC